MQFEKEKGALQAEINIINIEKNALKDEKFQQDEKIDKLNE